MGDNGAWFCKFCVGGGPFLFDFGFFLMTLFIWGPIEITVVLEVILTGLARLLVSLCERQKCTDFENRTWDLKFAQLN